MAGTSIKSTAFSPSLNLGLRAVFLRRDKAGRGKLGYIRKSSGRAPTQNHVWAVTLPCSLYHSTLYPNTILLHLLEALLFSLSLPGLVPPKPTPETIQNQIQISQPQVFPVIQLYSWKLMNGFLKI